MSDYEDLEGFSHAKADDIMLEWTMPSGSTSTRISGDVIAPDIWEMVDEGSDALRQVLKPFVNNPVMSDGQGRESRIMHRSPLSPTDLIITTVRFVAKRETVHAHRVMLAAWSEPFRAMFSNGWKECMSPEIHLDEGDIAPLKIMLEFMYSGSLKTLTPTMGNVPSMFNPPEHLADMADDAALPVLALANRYAVVRLQHIAENFIEHELAVENCCLFLMAADRFSCERLHRVCYDFTVRHFEPVVECDTFRMLSASCMHKLVQSDALFVRSEEIVFRAVSRWLATDPEMRMVHAPSLLQYIRFPLMHAAFLFEEVERDPLIGPLDILAPMLLEAYRSHAVAEVGLTPPWTHSMIERGKEQIVFGSSAGRLCALSKAMSDSHPLGNVRNMDEKYWLPINAERAEMMIELSTLYRLTKIKLQNRHSLEFEVLFKQHIDDAAWQGLVPVTKSGRHKAITEITLNKGNLHRRPTTLCRFLLVRLIGRAHSSYHTSIYWLEVMGIPAPEQSIKE